jgi:hypothetical protein
MRKTNSFNCNSDACNAPAFIENEEEKYSYDDSPS